MKKFNEYLLQVNKAINEVELPSEPNRLYEPIRYTMTLGGKRLRPILVLMTCDALGGDSSEYLNQAIGLEFFHNFTLLHDDLMDNADVRRGKPTVYRKWDENVAILSGDAMLSVANQIVTRNLQGDKLSHILSLFNRTAIEIYEGQQYDMDYEERTDTTIEEYINMIRLKTSVLFGAACNIGAVCANASKERQSAMYDFAVALGLAFQLQDDYLDVYGDEKTFGKAIGGDIQNAKRTFMLISAYQKADAGQKKLLDELLALDNKEHSVRKIEGVKALYNELGIPALAKERMEQYCAQAIDSLKKAELSNEDEQAFVELLNKLVDRKK